MSDSPFPYPPRIVAPRSPIRKRPTGHWFSWGRSVSAEGLVTWRLFRRDQRGALHCKQIVPRTEWPRAAIATEINRARHALRDQVDEVDLALMGVI